MHPKQYFSFAFFEFNINGLILYVFFGGNVRFIHVAIYLCSFVFTAVNTLLYDYTTINHSIDQ